MKQQQKENMDAVRHVLMPLQDMSYQQWHMLLHDIARQSANKIDQPNATLDSVFATWVHQKITTQHRVLIDKRVFTTKRCIAAQIVAMFRANGLLSGIPSVTLQSQTARAVYGDALVHVGMFTVPKNTSIPTALQLRYKEGTPTGLLTAVFIQYIVEQYPQFLTALESLLNNTLLPDNPQGSGALLPNGVRAAIVNQAVQHGLHDLYDLWLSGDTEPSITDWSTITEQFTEYVLHFHDSIVTSVNRNLP